MPNTRAPNAKWLQSAVLAHSPPEKREKGHGAVDGAACSKGPEPDELSRKGSGPKKPV